MLFTYFFICSRDQEDTRRKKQQQRLDNENRRRLKRLQSEKPKVTSLQQQPNSDHPNKENKRPGGKKDNMFGPSDRDISNAEHAEVCSFR